MNYVFPYGVVMLLFATEIKVQRGQPRCKNRHLFRGMLYQATCQGFGNEISSNLRVSDAVDIAHPETRTHAAAIRFIFD